MSVEDDLLATAQMGRILRGYDQAQRERILKYLLNRYVTIPYELDIERMACRDDEEFYAKNPGVVIE